MLPVFRLLAQLRRLRGTVFESFGKTAERRMERELIVSLSNSSMTLLSVVNANNRDAVSRIIRLYIDIRGFGPVKEESVHVVRSAITSAVQQLRGRAAKRLTNPRKGSESPGEIRSPTRSGQYSLGSR